MIKVDENDPIGELEPSFPYRDVQIKWNVDVKQFYELQSEIGRGKFGTVYKCKEKATGLALAAKFVAVARRQERKNVEREVEIMRELQHPRLIQIYDAFESRNVMCVVLELIEGGELFERVIDDDFVLTEKACTVFVRQICEAVEFIHSKNILHLDMKPENILCLTKTGNRIKIIDFGLARKFDPGKKLQVLFGTPEFVAPEVVNFDQIGFGTDMWSVGVICYVLLSGLSPFMGETDVATMANVTIATYDFDDDAFSTISEDAKDFIRRLLLKDKDQRMTATQALQHPWLRRRPPAPRPTVERLESTKDNLRSCVDRWGDQSPSAFIVQTPNIKDFETDEHKLLPSVVIPTDFQKENVLSPTSPQSPVPKKIKLQTEGEESKMKTTKKKDPKPGSKKSKSPSSSCANIKSSDSSSVVNSISAQPPKLNPMGKEPNKSSKLTPEDKQSPISVDSLNENAQSSSQVKIPLPKKWEEPSSPSQEKMECDVSPTSQKSNTKLKESTSNQFGKIKIQEPQNNIEAMTDLKEKESKSLQIVPTKKAMTSKTTVPPTSTVETEKEVKNVEPKQMLVKNIESKPDSVIGTDINSNYLNSSALSSLPGSEQNHVVQSPPVSPNIPVMDPKQNKTLSVTISNTGPKISSNPPTPLTPPSPSKVNVIPVTLENNSGRGKDTKQIISKPEEKSKQTKQLGNNISGLKSIWGSKISANEPKHHPIVKYNRTLSSPAANTGKFRTIGPKPQKLQETLQEHSQMVTSNGPKVILHRIEVEDSKDNLSSNHKSLESRLNPTNSISNKASDSSRRKPINEWVNDRLLHDRFNIDRRASDISSLVNSDSFYEDTADSVGSRLAEEISRITDKFCRINDEDKGRSDKSALMAQERHDKITDLLNGKRRPKYRRITHLNRDVPLGSMPPPTNLTYYLTNCLTSNSKSPLWAGTGCDFFSAPGTPVGSPRSPSEGSLDADMIFQMLSEKLKADAKLQSVTPAKKTGLINT